MPWAWDDCTCEPGRAHDGSEFGPCNACEQRAWDAGIDAGEDREEDDRC